MKLSTNPIIYDGVHYRFSNMLKTAVSRRFGALLRSALKSVLKILLKFFLGSVINTKKGVLNCEGFVPRSLASIFERLEKQKF